MNELLTVREYAKTKNISIKRVYDLIKKHKLKVKKIKNIMHVIVNEDVNANNQYEKQQKLQSDKQAVLLEKIKIDNELKKVRLLNVQQDTELKKLKNTVIQEKLRCEYAQEVLEVFINSFSTLKSYLTSLQLTKQQLDKLKQKIDESVKNFEVNLSDYLYQKNNEQIEDEE